VRRKRSREYSRIQSSADIAEKNAITKNIFASIAVDRPTAGSAAMDAHSHNISE
jgi:hypothetical protein